MRRRIGIAAALVFGAAAAGGLTARADDAPVPATQLVLLGAPDPAGPTTRGVWLEDPAGQIERIAAVGHLVAWTVRTPADATYSERDRRPIKFPTASQLVVIDERGGKPLVVDYPGRWISGLTAFRGPSGPADPQLAVRSCASREAASCTIEVLSLTTAAPIALRSRTSDRSSSAAYAGRLDSGRRVVIGKRWGKGKRKACLPRLSVRTLSTGAERVLPALPARDPDYPVCRGLYATTIYGSYAFAAVFRDERQYSLSAEYFYGIDLDAGPQSRWRLLQIPGRNSGGSASFSTSPAFTDRAVYWELFDSEQGEAYSLEQAALPRDLQGKRVYGVTETTSEPVAPQALDGCALAATDDAIYELANRRCAQQTWNSKATGGQIRRVVNPSFGPAKVG